MPTTKPKPQRKCGTRCIKDSCVTFTNHRSGICTSHRSQICADSHCGRRFYSKERSAYCQEHRKRGIEKENYYADGME